MEPELIKADTLNIVDGGFVETDRWKVVISGEAIGEIWRGKRDSKGCWFVVPACHGISLHQSYVSGGYAATTKKGAVSDLQQWHENRSQHRKVGNVDLHVFKRRDEEAEQAGSVLAVLPEGGNRWIHTTHRKSRQPHHGALSEPGWYANSRRGNRYVGADHCSSENEAIDLLLPEILAETTREDKLAIPPQTRLRGSLATAEAAA
jgi:hypothetical protein